MMTKIHRRRWLATGCSALAVLAAGCSGTAIPSTRHLETIVSVGTAVLNAPTFTEADELRLAQATAKKVEAENKVWSDPLLEAYLTQIMEKIVAVAKPRPWPYRVKVINQADSNAFTPGGGLIYIHAGLLARMESEAQFAMILAHEVAHVTEGHVIEGVKARYGIQLLGQLAAIAAGQTGVLPPGMLQLIYDYSMNAAINGHGRSREAEADEIGLGYLVKAGWDPREASKAFEALLREHGDQQTVTNFFYGNHPTLKSRIERTSELTLAKYAKEVEGKALVNNTNEWARRTRELVILTGKLDYERQRFNMATAMFQKAVRVGGRDPVPHYYLGKIALDTVGGHQALDRAIGHLLTATAADSQYAPAYRELGLAYYRKNDKFSAIAAFERYLALDPKARDEAGISQSIAELKLR